MLVRNNLPELGTDLVTALAGLDGHDLTHVAFSFLSSGAKKGVKVRVKTEPNAR